MPRIRVTSVTIIGLTILATTTFSAAAAAGPWTSGMNYCGSQYVKGHTSGNSFIWVNAAGAYSDRNVSYPEVKTVTATGDHNGTITNYASSTITSWGFVNCTSVH